MLNKLAKIVKPHSINPLNNKSKFLQFLTFHTYIFNFIPFRYLKEPTCQVLFHFDSSNSESDWIERHLFIWDASYPCKLCNKGEGKHISIVIQVSKPA